MEAYIFHQTKEIDVQYKKRSQPYAMPIFHYHDGYELYLLEEGTRTVLINDKQLVVQENDVILFAPHTFHRNSGGTAHTRRVIYFQKEYLEKYLTKDAIELLTLKVCNGVFSSLKEEFQEIKQMVINIENYLKKKEEEKCFIELISILRILNQIEEKKEARHLDNPMLDNLSLDNLTLDNGCHKEIISIIRYILHNFKNIQTLDEISGAFFISKHHLCRIFKQSTGLTITQYMNGLKIQEACDLLKKEKKTVTEIGYKVGFNSTMYFCKTFKNYVGITPKEYRQRNKV